MTVSKRKWPMHGDREQTVSPSQIYCIHSWICFDREPIWEFHIPRCALCETRKKTANNPTKLFRFRWLTHSCARNSLAGHMSFMILAYRTGVQTIVGSSNVKGMQRLAGVLIEVIEMKTICEILLLGSVPGLHASCFVHLHRCMPDARLAIAHYPLDCMNRTRRKQLQIHLNRHSIFKYALKMKRIWIFSAQKSAIRSFFNSSADILAIQFRPTEPTRAYDLREPYCQHFFWSQSEGSRWRILIFGRETNLSTPNIEYGLLSGNNNCFTARTISKMRINLRKKMSPHPFIGERGDRI